MKKLTASDQETRSADVVVENIEHLRNLFPEAFTEGKIDFEVLKQLLGDNVDDSDEKYGLNWHGKRCEHANSLLHLLPELCVLAQRRVWTGTRQAT